MKNDKKLFIASCAFFAISAFAPLLSFLGSYKGNAVQLFFAIATGVLFWLGLVLGILFLVICNAHRKQYERKARRKFKRRRWGVSCFFSNTAAAVFDILTALLIIATLATMFIPSIGENITFILAAFLLFSVYMHSMLNGVNFIYICTKSKSYKSFKEESLA